MIRFFVLALLLAFLSACAVAQSPVDANRALVEQAYDDFASGDVDAFLAILDPGVTGPILRLLEAGGRPSG